MKQKVGNVLKFNTKNGGKGRRPGLGFSQEKSYE
jgi:hypothetical protein